MGVKNFFILFSNAMKIHNLYFCCCTKLATGTPDEAFSKSEISDPDLFSESSNNLIQIDIGCGGWEIWEI